MTPKVAKTLSLYAGILLLVIGALAFVPNPIVGPEGLMARDPLVRYIPVLFGLALLGASAAGESTAAFALYMIGGLSILFAGVAYSQIGEGGSALLLDTLRMRLADVVFLALAGVSLVICGKMNTSKQQLFYD
jgi:hypothetical protein